MQIFGTQYEQKENQRQVCDNVLLEFVAMAFKAAKEQAECDQQSNYNTAVLTLSNNPAKQKEFVKTAKSEWLTKSNAIRSSV